MKKYFIPALLSSSLVVLFVNLYSFISRPDVEKLSHSNRQNEYMLLAVLYQQTAAEVRALQYQVYQIARRVLDEKLSKEKFKKPPAIIVDVDETVLDNSPYEAQCILGNFKYPQNWDVWCMLAKAQAIPGSVEFLNYAYSRKVKIFYITNRKEHLKQATIKNLIDVGFPDVSDETVLCYQNTSSKELRRQKIREKYDVIMMFGDNLLDFTDDWAHKSIEQRFFITDSLRHKFGTEYFVLPNAMYGDWEGAIYNYDFGLDEAVKYRLRMNALRGF